MQNLNIVCTCSTHHNQKRPTYTKMWVDRLYYACARNIHIPFKFWCLSNTVDHNKDYTVLPLIMDSWGWWNKLEQFRKNLFTGPVLSIDLDVIICKNITQQLESLSLDKFYMVNEPHNNIANSSIMFWNGDYSFLFDEYNNNQQQIINTYSEPGNRMGDQAYISERVDVSLLDTNFEPQQIAWKHHLVQTEINDPSLLIFTSTEKPSNNLDMDIVKNNWIDQ